MRFSTFSLLASLAASAVAEDLLFIDSLKYQEYTEATEVDGFTAKVVTEAEWRAMSTADFAAFKAIILSDPMGSSDTTILQFLEDTKAVWSPAILGNMILIGGDPTNHFDFVPGAKVLEDNAIKFAASGKSTTGASLTGLYFALSQYYDTIAGPTTVTTLSYFGDFEVRGDLSCYDKAHIVASSPALGALDDVALSNWGCSVHEAFSTYPSTGTNGFQALAIAQDIIGAGSQTFGDKTIGLPYIISRGATPAGCGDGIWDATLGEECDDGNTVAGDGCSVSCKCESGRPDGNGKCLPALISNSSSSRVSASPVPYGNLTVTTTATVTFTPPPYVTPSVPSGPIIIGIEIIVYVTIIESCTTIGTSTITNYITSACSTMNKPIYNTEMPGYPCYVCAMSSQGIACPSSSFITATTTICPSSPTHSLPPPVIQTCATCFPTPLSVCPALTPTLIPSASVYIVPQPSVVSHTEHNTVAPVPVTSYTAAPVPTTHATVTGTGNVIAPTTTGYPTNKPVPFMGGASGGARVGGVIGVVGGAMVAVALAL